MAAAPDFSPSAAGTSATVSCGALARRARFVRVPGSMPQPAAPNSPAFAVILAGGGGTRLWPSSRRARPKQLLALGGPESLLAAAVRRAQAVVGLEHTLIVTAADQEAQIRAVAAARQRHRRAHAAQHGTRRGPGRRRRRAPRRPRRRHRRAARRPLHRR